MSHILFNDALRIAAGYYAKATALSARSVYIIRDMYGRISFAIDDREQDYSPDAKSILESSATALGAFAAPKALLFREDLYDFSSFLGRNEYHETQVQMENDQPPISIRLIDRQITGQDWLSTSHEERQPDAPPRIVFFSLKGGVGRSTALSMLALHLAGLGKRVLLFDFDLESPGLGSLLLQPENAAPFGIVDWFVEDGVQQGFDILKQLVTTSSLGDGLSGIVRVAGAAGLNESNYLSKLARVYADVPSSDGPKRFASRMVKFVELLEAQEKPDVVLIDSRAGLHDLAAISIVTLADLALLFSVNSPQSWQGYSHLFRSWQQTPAVARHVRERLQIIYGLYPEADQQGHLRSFVRRSSDLFRETLYDEIPPGASDPDISVDNFSFDEPDTIAPHYPWLIRWNPRFLEFDPFVPAEEGGLSGNDVQIVYGQFLARVESFLEQKGTVAP